MDAGYAVAACALPFITGLEREISALAGVGVAGDGDVCVDGVEAPSLESARRRLAHAADAAVRALPRASAGVPGAAAAFAYGLVGLADERMLHHPAGLIEGWRARLLETELYASAVAGEEVVRRARSAARAGHDPGDDDGGLGPTFYLALMRAGFEGELRGDRGGLAELVSALEEAAGIRGIDLSSSSDLTPAGLRVHRGALSPGVLAGAAALVWLASAPVLWTVFAGPALAESTYMAERLRAGLDVSVGADAPVHGIGPVVGHIVCPDSSRC